MVARKHKSCVLPPLKNHSVMCLRSRCSKVPHVGLICSSDNSREEQLMGTSVGLVSRMGSGGGGGGRYSTPSKICRFHFKKQVTSQLTCEDIMKSMLAIFCLPNYSLRSSTIKELQIYLGYLHVDFCTMMPCPLRLPNHTISSCSLITPT